MYEFRKHAPHLLSGGQKQRVAIAGIIAMRPKIIILDEPTAMLDPSGREEVMIEVQRAAQRRDRLSKRVARLRSVQVFPSATNFLLVKVTDPDVLHELFISKSIGVRNFSHVPELKGCLRITIGNPVETMCVYDCLKDYDELKAGEEGR